MYADWLIDRGDPRGEFVQLQLLEAPDEAQQARMQQLQAKHLEALLGSLGPVIRRTDLSFRRGFLSRCVVDFPYLQDALRHSGDPAWSTVEAVTLPAGRAGFDIAPLVLDNPAMTSLVEVRGLPPDLAEQVFAGPPRPWTTVGLRGVRLSRAMQDRPGLPRLRRLALQVGHTYTGFLHQVAGLLELPWIRDLGALEVQVTIPTAAQPWARAVRHVGPPLIVQLGSWQVRIVAGVAVLGWVGAMPPTREAMSVGTTLLRSVRSEVDAVESEVRHPVLATLVARLG